jgi:hypothetical protein
MQDFHSTAGSYLKVCTKFMFQITLLIVSFSLHSSSQNGVLQPSIPMALNHANPTTDARILLSRAVEAIPLSVELWLALALALARIETPECTKDVLN